MRPEAVRFLTDHLSRAHPAEHILSLTSPFPLSPAMSVKAEWLLLRVADAPGGSDRGRGRGGATRGGRLGSRPVILVRHDSSGIFDPQGPSEDRRGSASLSATGSRGDPGGDANPGRLHGPRSRSPPQRQGSQRMDSRMARGILERARAALQEAERAMASARACVREVETYLAEQPAEQTSDSDARSAS